MVEANLPKRDPKTKVVPIKPGDKFEDWTVLGLADKKSGREYMWLCVCKCGTELAIRASRLRKGRAVRCHACAVTKHGKSPRAGFSPLCGYGNWKAMIQRCTNPNHKEYPRYGGSGITIQAELRDFAVFHAHMGDKADKKQTIERKDGTKGYEIGNIVWATVAEQNRNHSRNVLLTHDGQTLILTDWATKLGLRPGTIKSRLKLGWTVADALTIPVATLFRHKHKQKDDYTPLQLPEHDITSLEEIPSDPQPETWKSTAKNAKHGMYKSAEYRAWAHMKDRCCNPNCKTYPDYGGRGIRICQRWLESFENFLADMGLKPTRLHELERIDNDKGYCPENCCWKVRAEQLRNTRRTMKITYQGVTMCLTDWSRHLGIGFYTLRARICDYGWSVEKAFSIPAQRRKKTPPANAS